MSKKIISGESGDCQYRFEIGFTKLKGQASYFSITGTTWELGRPKVDKYMITCGALKVGDYVPELAYLDKYHLMSIDSPMHYIANSLYHASNKDCHGLLKGEKRQIKNGKTGQPCWELVAVDKSTGEVKKLYQIDNYIDANCLPPVQYELAVIPLYRIGDGKEPNLQAARDSAIWPEARLEDFTREKLEARLPELMSRFKDDVEKFGLDFPKE